MGSGKGRCPLNPTSFSACPCSPVLPWPASIPEEFVQLQELIYILNSLKIYSIEIIIFLK
jgi:hypothetical protein